MGKNGMIQWAPGTKPQKYDRTGYPFTWSQQVALDAEKVERNAKPDEREKKEVGFKTGDIVLCAGQFYRAGEIDPNGHWVMLGVHKHGTDLVKLVPQNLWAEYLAACHDLGMETV